MMYMAAMAPWFREIADRGADISECGTYRYRLWRYLGPQERVATFIMLNPSTADAVADDPTIRRCAGFARAWDCGRLVVVNLFALRATNPSDMKKHASPIGADNDQHIIATAKASKINGGKLVCAWGAHGSYNGRDRKVLALLKEIGVTPQCLGTTKNGMPKHPLYLAANSALAKYSPRNGEQT